MEKKTPKVSEYCPTLISSVTQDSPPTVRTQLITQIRVDKRQNRWKVELADQALIMSSWRHKMKQIKTKETTRKDKKTIQNKTKAEETNQNK